MLEIKVESNTITPALNALAAKLGNLSPLMKDIAGIMEAGVEDNFDRQGIPAWDALSPVTIKRREKQGKWPGKMLQVTGQLASSVTSDFDAGSAVVGTNDVRAKTLHFGANKGAFGKTKRGAPIPWGNIPARPFMALSAGAIGDITRAIREFAKPPGR